jgi:hypothetical protein
MQLHPISEASVDTAAADGSSVPLRVLLERNPPNRSFVPAGTPAFGAREQSRSSKTKKELYAHKKRSTRLAEQERRHRPQASGEDFPPRPHQSRREGERSRPEEILKRDLRPDLGLTAREERNRASCLRDLLKLPLFLEFISNGVTNIGNNHMPLEHYIGRFTAWEMVLFHHDIVTFCAKARENNPRMGVARQELSVCAPERNTVRVLHCNSSLHRESA